jgi:hypothetical protein
LPLTAWNTSSRATTPSGRRARPAVLQIPEDVLRPVSAIDVEEATALGGLARRQPFRGHDEDSHRLPGARVELATMLRETGEVSLARPVPIQFLLIEDVADASKLTRCSQD